MFLEEPIKLPTVNIDLPLVASAILLPLLFVVYHIFVLLQVVLLARTADAYNEAIEHGVPEAPDRTRIRQRLANTLFAQLFAGSPREREGVLGWLLRLMAWITLAIGPVLVLLLFQVKFLPYQSAAVTWSHRTLFAFDLLAVLLLWSAAVNVQRDIAWRALVRDKASATFAVVAIVVSVLPLTYPGEPHTAWINTLFYEDEYNGTDAAECRLPKAAAAILPLGFDRLAVSGTILIDTDRLARIEKATAGQKPHRGERTRSLAGRNFNCAILSGTDLRRVDLSGASLIGALLEGADLRGARLANSVLRKASMNRGELEDTDLAGAQLQRAQIRQSKLQRANLEGANLERADLSRSELTGASLANAHLPGSSLYDSDLEGADMTAANLSGANLQVANLFATRLSSAWLQATDLSDARLQGADLSLAKLSGARLVSARLQGAYLEGATIDGAFLAAAQLQGASVPLTVMTRGAFAGANLWRTTWRLDGSQSRITCDDAYVVGPRFDPVLSTVTDQGKDSPDQIAITPEILRGFGERVKKSFPKLREVERNWLLALDEFVAAQPGDDIARQSEAAWRGCAEKAVPESKYDEQLVTHLIGVGCAPRGDEKYIAEGIYTLWLFYPVFEKLSQRALARGLLGLDGPPCFGSAKISADVRRKLQKIVTADD
jgi:uncharacterized protein YjbI with pentapeptide repeats